MDKSNTIMEDLEYLYNDLSIEAIQIIKEFDELQTNDYTELKILSEHLQLAGYKTDYGLDGVVISVEGQQKAIIIGNYRISYHLQQNQWLAQDTRTGRIQDKAFNRFFRVLHHTKRRSSSN